uniref:Short-chain collagen C4 n=1 Tax=Branchiostoma floridae TaxID=7739 RepID=C3ZR26_BRAFL|eukprot:XP_002589056.1 hypothetical protein BRAFLDRAFT_87529 [Branchiostoma floridae]
MATILVPGASLKNKNFLGAIQQAGSVTMYPLPAEPARFVTGKSLSSTPVDELSRMIRQLCDTDPRALLTMAKMEEDDRQSWVTWKAPWPTRSPWPARSCWKRRTGWTRRTARAGTGYSWSRRACWLSGVAGGTSHVHQGGGTNYQCVPADPQWGKYQDGVQGHKAFMWGAEYELDTNVPFGSTSLHNNDVPCAVCYVPTRGSKLMIPARNTCPTGWTREYHGYLMAGYYNHPGATEYVCMDEEPDVIPGGHADQNGALFYPVEARCGSLPCPNYVEGRELTCVVCTK